ERLQASLSEQLDGRGSRDMAVHCTAHIPPEVRPNRTRSSPDPRPAKIRDQGFELAAPAQLASTREARVHILAALAEQEPCQPGLRQTPQAAVEVEHRTGHSLLHARHPKFPADVLTRNLA